MFVFAAAVFRSEVALLLGATILHQLIIPSLSLERVFFPFTTSFLVALITSIPIDSYFWQRPLWPELWGFYYNVVRGSASNWGVSPWHYYFTSALPRLLINPLTYTLLIPYALYHPALRRAASRLLVPSLLFTALYSLQPHKETRFIFYVVPPVTAAAALAANALFTPRNKSPLSTLLAFLLALSILASFTASTAMLSLSALNYPGGEALAHLRSTILSTASSSSINAAAATTIPADSTTPPNTNNIQPPEDGTAIPIHADVLSCMTGVTLFTTSTAASIREAGALAAVAHHLPPVSDNTDDDTAAAQSKVVIQHDSAGSDGGSGGATSVRIVVDKTEDAALLRDAAFWRQFAYVLVEDPRKVVGGQWEAVGVVKGYAGIEVVQPGGGGGKHAAGEEGDGDEVTRGSPPVVGMGRTVALWKRRVRAVTGGWWVGPRMVERVYILRRVRDAEKGRVAVESR
jgi:alpha-1,6-mannosyltransferase